LRRHLEKSISSSQNLSSNAVEDAREVANSSGTGESQDLTFVHIDVKEPSLFAPLRKQVRSDGCCTLEAAAYCMRELGESDVADNWIHNLKVFVDTIRVQSRGEQLYGTFSDDERAKMTAVKRNLEPPF